MGEVRLMSADINEIRKALEIGPWSTAWERTIDVTTIGAKTGRPRRLEIWFHRVEGRWYLSSIPATRAWYANLLVNPRFTFHLKHGVVADLAATAVPITDPELKRPIFAAMVDDMNQPHNPALIHQPTHLDDWMAGSPLVEILFDDIS
jgi:hypothetical protein